MRMQSVDIYIKDWLAIHPYTRQQGSDHFFVTLAQRLYRQHTLPSVPATVRKKACLYLAAYLEDLVSGLGLWQTFTQAHQALYDTLLPFYPLTDAYVPGEVNEADIRFLLWNTWQKALHEHPYINPLDAEIASAAQTFLPLLEEAYETAPENEALQAFFVTVEQETEARQKLRWLFGHTYLTEPSVQEYIAQVTESDQFIIPCGPLALFLHEWIERLAGAEAARWQCVPELYPATPALPEERKARNHQTYRLFTQGTNGAPVVYLQGYPELRRFLTQVLQWPDDDNHTLPQLKPHRNFVMMAHPEKGVLLAKDICECIHDPLNPLYNPAEATRHAFQLLTQPTLCPPDLMDYLIAHHYLPDAQLPLVGEKELVQRNADFIARHTLLYYYRGD